MKIEIRITHRPFRLYNAKTKKYMPWRCYKHFRNAHIGALIEARWAPHVGAVIEVVDVSKGRMVGQYRRGLTSVIFSKGDE